MTVSPTARLDGVFGAVKSEMQVPFVDLLNCHSLPSQVTFH